MNALAPLRHPPFRLLLSGRVVNALGNAVAPIALAFAVLDLTGSPRDLGLVVGARTLVNVIFLLFGGVLADRLPRHLLMVGTSVAAAATQGVVAVLVLSDSATIPLLITFGACNGLFSALAMPASAALLPQTVPEDERQQANALSRLFFNATSIVGAAAGGVMIAAIGPGWGIAIDAATFLLAAACFAFVRVPPRTAVVPPGGSGDVPEMLAGQTPAAGAAGGNIVADLRTGWTEFLARTWLWVVVVGFCVVNACVSGGINVLGPVVADDTFGRRAWGFVLAAQTGGMVLGAIVAMRIRVRRLLFLGVICTAALTLPLFALATAPILWVVLVVMFVAGLSIEQFGIAWETTMQEHVSADKLARVYSYDMVGSFVAIPVGQVIAGPVAQAVGVEPTLIGAGVLVGLAVLGMLASRDVRHLEHRLPSAAGKHMEELPA